MSMRINNINSPAAYYSKAQEPAIRDNYKKLSSGKKINSAKDDAAGLAISEKMLSAINKANKEIENYQDEKSMLNVSDSMYSGTNDYLMDMYSQAVRSSSSLLSDDDRQVLTDYMSELKKDAASMLETTRFNEMKVADKNAAKNLPSDFDISTIKDSINSFNAIRSKDGARYNGLEHRIANKEAEAINTTAAVSRIADTEYGSAVSELNRNRTLETYRYQMQNRQMQDANNSVTGLF
ncbi:MAG: hypothetical protein J5829_10440 [Lachnospiraceae bacterium]|nr:hypothetical protein [Lachnospiraceae bacterium]